MQLAISKGHNEWVVICKIPYFSPFYIYFYLFIAKSFNLCAPIINTSFIHSKSKQMKKQLLTLLLGMAFAFSLHAQVTTSAIAGYVMDDSNQPLPGANVLATHTPSGTVYGVITRDDGGYTIPNMRVGGPYLVEVSFVGYDKKSSDGIYLKLGEKLRHDVMLKESSTQLGEIEVVASGASVINNDRTGAATFIKNEQIRNMPTITRSTADLTRLNPMAAEGGSFAGRNDQYNNYSLDGSIFNNPFGLDAATPGGQADAQPVSLDAIEQITVSIAPYDVSQSGFTGASIDAVTKSGTNELKGSVFAYYRNKDMLGIKVDDVEVTRGDLTQLQTGFSIGGPIVKNKIFYFANFELLIFAFYQFFCILCSKITYIYYVQTYFYSQLLYHRPYRSWQVDSR